MSKIAIVYGSSTGATEAVAEKIQAALGEATLLMPMVLVSTTCNHMIFLF